MVATLTKQLYKRAINQPSGKHKYLRYLTEERTINNKLRVQAKLKLRQSNLEQLKVDDPLAYQLQFGIGQIKRHLEICLYGDGIS